MWRSSSTTFPTSSRRTKLIGVFQTLAALVALTCISYGAPLPQLRRPQLPAQAAPAAQRSTLPLDADSVKFAVIGDTGTGERAQYDVGQRLANARARFPFEFVIMLGDNLYGSEAP